MKKKKKIVLGVALALLLAIGGTVLPMWGGDPPPEGTITITQQ